MGAFEQVILDASKTLSGTTIGAILLLVVGLFAALIWMYRRDMAELRKAADAALHEIKQDLRQEREDHQATRERYMAELKSIAGLAQSIEESRVTDFKMHQMIAETLGKLQYEIRDFTSERRRG